MTWWILVVIGVTIILLAGVAIAAVVLAPGMAKRKRIRGELDRAENLVTSFLVLKTAGKNELAADVQNEMKDVAPEAITAVAKGLALDAVYRSGNQKMGLSGAPGADDTVDYEQRRQWLMQLMDEANRRPASNGGAID